ncbi:MAG: hypothetical protein IKD58_08385, partial [Loktanella sp.]|nr:hypothetical protein [Loktanella sp.]
VNTIPTSESISPSQARPNVHAFSSKRDSPARDFGLFSNPRMAELNLSQEILEGVLNNLTVSLLIQVYGNLEYLFF